MNVHLKILCKSLLKHNDKVISGLIENSPSIKTHITAWRTKRLTITQCGCKREKKNYAKMALK